MSKKLYPDVKNIESLGENFVERRNITDKEGITSQQLVSMLSLKADMISPNENDLITKLSKQDAVVKFGIDPTGSEIHLGHTIPMNILRLIQATGRDITFIIGDFTAKIGDPTGRSSERKALTDEDIKNNYHSYKQQAAKFVNMDKANVVFNTSHLQDIQLEEITKLFQKVSMGALLQRDDFRKRIEGGHGLSLAEVFYPLLMALDSIKLKADIEIGGKDQLLNFHITRELMEKYNLPPEAFVTVPLLPGITGTGEKMSKSLGNYIGLLEPANEIFGKVMSIPDSLIELYLTNTVDMLGSEKEYFAKLIQENPYLVKKALAYYIASNIQGTEQANEAISDFERKFSKKDLNEEDFKPIQAEPGKLIDILVANGILKSKTEARRHIENGAIRALSESKEFDKISDINFEVATTIYLKVGKKEFIKIEI